MTVYNTALIWDDEKDIAVARIWDIKKGEMDRKVKEFLRESKTMSVKYSKVDTGDDVWLTLPSADIRTGVILK